MFVAQQTPLLVYRVINHAEITATGSDKSPFEFFTSVFSSPEGTVENSLISSLEDYTISAKEKGGIKVYFLENHQETKLYITSPDLDFVIEVISEGEDSQHNTNAIFNKIKLTNRT